MVAALEGVYDVLSVSLQPEEKSGVEAVEVLDRDEVDVLDGLVERDVEVGEVDCG